MKQEKSNTKKISSKDIEAVVKAFNEAKVPTKDRYGYQVLNDGTIKIFGPTK